MMFPPSKQAAPLIGAGALIAIAVGVAISLQGGFGPSDEGTSSSSSSFVATTSSAATENPGTNTTDLPISVPDGYELSIFADVPGARDIVKDGFGNYWVSQTSRGTITHLEMSGSTVRLVLEIFRELDNPHGLAIDPENGMDLYFAEETKISRARLYSDAPVETIAELPRGAQHVTRSLGFGPDGRLYVSIGSTCNVCVEKDERIAAILSMNRDGSDQKIVAKGLRNSVFFAWHPTTGDLWATDMGRDLLGDTTPPEEVNIIRKGAHYGWPFCYGDRIRDGSFMPLNGFDCGSTEIPHIQLPAHIAPLGLAFFHGDLLVAEHGSWNSSVKVGYKVVRVPLDASGRVVGEPVDFLGGFLQGTTVHGRPVDLLPEEDGSLLITDDRRGVVYRLMPHSAQR